ncbi:glutathione-dependent formaldehyde dehydrogenase [Burkholderia dolosa]|jgi:threonine dehydrogenase-like Zn-dependent dehydrogenase|uniref:Glutathione-dependent formaldehyde dehydrogenase n=1 Tax=Burkholderia dolosa TaxID=152500 RepID=A0A892IEK2_9BURK|nr:MULTISPECIES: zinc-dependent alcohol dehydrogenase [Burkholderia]AKE02007.1 zinc-binding dehydrogenase [Burkholderia cepacia]AJY11080.1 zinc-binding dehydrogenase family protein [Burkholderia dolosa AU0158]AYZ95566.1 glutathione-dependent formaldehyde dehydrogenase [Burkholderia dolosa]MBR8418040.1 glutathione-dependent formaldehyde dehydrogenase [Burkholderia dolosa]MBY4658933.1 glutathione-dependent formaldehyde dehydrogenase [Burkholderia dolosa]
MMALCWHGKRAVRYERVDDPAIEHPRDAIVKVTLCGIGGADLHLYDAAMPGLKDGAIPGREFMGEVVEVGRDVDAARLRVGDRVAVPFAIACGECRACRRGDYAVCDASNPNRAFVQRVYGRGTGALFGGGHLAGGYPGGHAEYVRVPYADVGPIKIPDEIDDERALPLGDALPAGWQAAVQCEIRPNETVAVWGAGPVGLYAMLAARVLGAGHVIAIDCVPARLERARMLGATPIDFTRLSVADTLADHTHGRGPDKCIDAVGLGAHAVGAIDAPLDRFDETSAPGVDSPHVLREAIYACRPGGIVSVAGLYGGLVDSVPVGALVNKALTLRAAQAHVQRWSRDLLTRIANGQIDPSFVVTHRARLEDGPQLYETSRSRADGCIKAVMRPGD